MSGGNSFRPGTAIIAFLALLAVAQLVSAEDEVIPFDSPRWQMLDAQVVEHLGRQALIGTAVLEDVDLANGVVEYDLAVTGARSYPGALFRMQSRDNYERFYVRPHRAGLYPDALQYTPVINKVAGWQLYDGEGFTAATAKFPTDRWFHVKIEFSGSQARVFVDGAAQPGLEIPRLQHGESTGGVGLMGPKDGTAFFSNFSYRQDDGLVFAEVPALETPPGTIMEWQISQAFKAAQVDTETYPRFFQLYPINWKKVITRADGLLDIARYAQRAEGGPDAVIARTTIPSDKKQTIKLSFGYSDEIGLFFNGKKVFHGKSYYQGRDPSFLGIVGLNDTAYLELQKGLNEVYVVVTERFGGWGIKFQADIEIPKPAEAYNRMTKVWESPADLRIPESVLYDPERGILYVSSYSRASAADANTGFISRLSLEGEIIERDWVTGLDGPCGMGLHGGKLYVVECTGHLVEIDPNSGEVLNRYRAPDSRFLNDLAIDGEGNIYISDTSPPLGYTSVIYRFRDGEFEIWVGGDEISRANGLFIHDGKLIVGNSGDCMLKAVDLKTRCISTVTCLAKDVIDGIRVDNEGNYIVSLWRGQTFLISPEGDVVEVLNTLDQRGINIADFEFVKERNLLVVPTFYGNKVVAYRLNPE